MGKNLKGKECGKGICQRKDGLYNARFVNKQGIRKEKNFTTLPQARNWLADMLYAQQNENIFVPTDMTVDTGFEYRGGTISSVICRPIHGEITVNGTFSTSSR